MRICILCEDSKVKDARKKMKNENILSIEVSETGSLPTTHWFCSMIVDKAKADKIKNVSEYSTVEIMEPNEFLEKWNLKIIR